MNGAEFQFACLNDPRLAAQALSPAPVWLWSAQAPRILWANPVGAAIFDAATPAAAANISFEPGHAAAAQIVRLAGTLPAGGAQRLERLRGFGASFGGALICLCSRLALADNTQGVLVVSTERAGKNLALPERARRLLADLQQPAAIFSADGELIDAVPEARERFGKAADLTALGAALLAREAMLNGRAEGEIAAGRIAMLRLGAGQTAVALLLAFPAPALAARPSEPEQAPSAPNPAASEPRARHVPLRFVWQMDAANRFTLGAEDFARLLGPKIAAVLDRPWAEIAAALKLDPVGQVAAALAARDTWSGIVVNWPVDDDNDRLPIEMSGLPVFDRERQFAGFRGFGICRDVDRLTALERGRAAVSVPPEEPAKVLPFRAPSPPPPVQQAPALSPGEHSAFQELARELGERLKKPGNPAGPTSDDFGAEPFVARAAGSAGPAAARRAQRRCRARHQRRPADPRPAAGRHPGLPPQYADLCQPRLPRLDRLRKLAGTGRGRRARQPVHRNQG